MTNLIELHLGLPQVLTIAISFISFCITSANHGKIPPPYSIYSHIAAIVIAYSLLIWGGYFS